MSTSLLNRARIPFNLEDPRRSRRLCTLRRRGAVPGTGSLQRRTRTARRNCGGVSARILRTETPAFTAHHSGHCRRRAPPLPRVELRVQSLSLRRRGHRRAHGRAERRLADRVAAVARRFAHHGVDIKARTPRPGMSTRSDAFLEVAARLAHEVATTAGIRGDRRCNWVAAVEGSRASGRRQGDLGPDLYGGTSGVALFLAEAGVRLDVLSACAPPPWPCDSAGPRPGRPDRHPGRRRGSTAVASESPTRASASPHCWAPRTSKPERSSRLYAWLARCPALAEFGSDERHRGSRRWPRHGWPAATVHGGQSRAARGRVDRASRVHGSGVVLDAAGAALDAQPLRVCARRRRDRARLRRALRRHGRLAFQECGDARVRLRALMARP